MKLYRKNETLLTLLARLNREAQSGIFQGSQHYCQHCKCFRFDPLLNRKEAGAYINFSPDSMTVFDSTGRYDFQPVKLDNGVRYHLSSLNKFADQRLRPQKK